MQLDEPMDLTEMDVVVEGAEQLNLTETALELNTKRQEVLKARLLVLQDKLNKIDDTIVSYSHSIEAISVRRTIRTKLMQWKTQNCPKARH